MTEQQSNAQTLINFYTEEVGYNLENLFGETWKVVENTNGIYEISNLGRLKTHNWRNTGKTRIMKPSPYKGYYRTMIIINGKPKTQNLHALVAKVFIGTRPYNKQINHKDFNRWNNRVENLEYVSPAENFHHSANAGRQSVFLKNKVNVKTLKIFKGSANVTSKLSEKKVLLIREKFKPRIYTRKMLAHEFGVKEATIKDVVMRKSWKHVR